MKKYALILLAFLLVCTSAAADSSVKYEGGAEKFVFLAGSGLFTGFNNVMPGDVLEERIRIENSTDNEVRIYMRAEGSNKQDQDFLNQLHLIVKAGDSTIFDAQSDEKAKLTENTLLGTFKKNGGTDLTVTLTVPSEMSSESMHNIDIVPWTFMVEEIEDGETHQIGDWFKVVEWGIAVFVIMAIIVQVLVALKRGKKA